MISLIMPPKDQVCACWLGKTGEAATGSTIAMLVCLDSDNHGHAAIMQVSRAMKMLGDELGTASNIKSKVNRLSVLGAITSAQQRLKLYNKVPAWPWRLRC